MKAASNEPRRLAYMSPVTVMISLGGSTWTNGTVRVSPGIADWLSVRRIMGGGRQTAPSVGMGFEWRSMANAGLTAENRLRRRVRQVAGVKDTQHTKIRVVSRSPPYLTQFISYYAVSLYIT
jgi:hypothetical protein